MSKNIATGSANGESVDEELDELLDSALSDFDKPANTSVDAKDEKTDKEVVDFWGTEFEAQEAQEELKLMEQKMKELFTGLGDGAFGGNESFDDNLKKMTDEASKYFADSTTRDPELTDKIAQALKNLSVDVENIKTQMEPEALSSMFNGLQFGEADSQNDFLPLMQNMMQMFLSKEVFYHPLKDVCEKFPAWLIKEKDNISEQEFQNYSNQHKLLEKVCYEFEQEKTDDSDDIKKERFTKILALIDEIQKFGLLPQEFTDDAAFQNLDELGLPSNMPGFEPGQCSLM